MMSSSDSDMSSLSPSKSGSDLVESSVASSTVPPSEDPVTIVGLACRVPGAENPSELWDNIVDQKDLQQKMPTDRFNVDAFFHPNGKNKGTVSHKMRYLLKTRIEAKNCRQMPGTAIFSTKISPISTLASSAYLARKPRPWIRNNVSCWKWCMRL